jgi:electron transfer flavoprotein beta subunit
VIVVARKWIAGDERWAHVSDADDAALEVGLRLAEAMGDTVRAVTVGPPGADRVLREALAAGAARAVRVQAPAGLASEHVAAAIAGVTGDASWVICGDASADRGSGAVPAYLAAELGSAQALGLIEVAPDGESVHAVRRLDGGRREVLQLCPPAVLSVEGSVARLRRAALGAEVAARTAPIEVRTGPPGPVVEPTDSFPYRPRPRVLALPHGDALDRVRALTAVSAEPAAHGEVVTLDPAAAAARILQALAAWGYLDTAGPQGR